MKIKLRNYESFYIEKNGYSYNILDERAGDFDWIDLVNMKAEGVLLPGRKYRLMNYRCCNSLGECDRHHNYFGILLTADAPDSFSEDATLFYDESIAELSSWVDALKFKSYISKIKVKYCLDNDLSRFSWAAEDARGVIYRMIDEYGNDMPFDFIHMKFKRYIPNTSYPCPMYYSSDRGKIDFFPAGLTSILPNINSSCPMRNMTQRVLDMSLNYSNGRIGDFQLIGDLWNYLKYDEYYQYVLEWSENGENLLLPCNTLFPDGSQDYLKNKRPSNNVISPRYIITSIDGREYMTMTLPDITITLDHSESYVRINNNYFGPNVDNISILSSLVENNKFDGTINNVFFSGFYTTNVNITKNAFIEDTILSRLVNVDIGGYLENTWFLFPIKNSSINGEIRSSLIFCYIIGTDTFKNLNIEKSAKIINSVLTLPTPSFLNYRAGILLGLSLRDLKMINSYIGFDFREEEIEYFNVTSLSGWFEGRGYNLLDGGYVTNQNLNESYLHALTNGNISVDDIKYTTIGTIDNLL